MISAGILKVNGSICYWSNVVFTNVVYHHPLAGFSKSNEDLYCKIFQGLEMLGGSILSRWSIRYSLYLLAITQHFWGWSRNYPVNQDTIMAPDSAGPRVIRTVATVVLTTQYTLVVSIYSYDFKLLVPSQCWAVVLNFNMFSCFLK